jgi:hypothetical protein
MPDPRKSTPKFDLVSRPLVVKSSIGQINTIPIVKTGPRGGKYYEINGRKHYIK